MPKTSVDISFGLYDVSAKQDITNITAPTKQSFVELDDLKMDGVYPPKVATLEENYWKLDGTFELFPDDPENTTWGYWSRYMNPAGYIQIYFADLHESNGISFEFNPHDNSYPSQIRIDWYKKGSNIGYKVFDVDDWRFTASHKVVGFDRVRIRVLGMNKSNRYLRIQNIKFGEDILFPPKYVADASVLEEADLLSSELSVNTLDFTLHDADGTFNVFSPVGLYELLQKKQQLSVEGKIDGERVPFGNFYVDKWDTAGAEIKISAVDAIGIMDSTVFNGGVYNNSTVSDLVSEVLSDAGFGYTVETDLSEKVLSGWIPRCTHREALQQIAFAAGAYVDTSRGGMVAIKALSTQTPRKLGRNRKFKGSTVSLNPYVTGVDLTIHQYSLDVTRKDVFKGELPEGENEIVFNVPAENLTVTGATIVQSGVNYCLLYVPSAGEVTIKGAQYLDNTSIQRARVEEIEPGEKEKTLEIKEATLISESNAEEIASGVLLFYQRRLEQNLSWVLGREAPGSRVEVEVEKDVWREARITRLETDLTGGFVTKGVLIGD